MKRTFLSHLQTQSEPLKKCLNLLGQLRVVYLSSKRLSRVPGFSITSVHLTSSHTNKFGLFIAGLARGNKTGASHRLKRLVMALERGVFDANVGCRPVSLVPSAAIFMTCLASYMHEKATIHEKISCGIPSCRRIKERLRIS